MILSFSSLKYTHDPDLTFNSCDVNSLSPHPVHKIVVNFPKSQHRPTIIHHPGLVKYTITTPTPRRNFMRADWDVLKQNLRLCVIIFLHLAQALTPATLRSRGDSSTLQKGLRQGVFATSIFLVGIPHVKC